MKKQKQQGAIDLEMTSVLAPMSMMWWDRECIRKRKEEGLNIWIYKRYVDDINIVMSKNSPTSSRET